MSTRPEVSLAPTDEVQLEKLYRHLADHEDDETDPDAAETSDSAPAKPKRTPTLPSQLAGRYEQDPLLAFRELTTLQTALAEYRQLRTAYNHDVYVYQRAEWGKRIAIFILPILSLLVDAAHNTLNTVSIGVALALLLVADWMVPKLNIQARHDKTVITPEYLEEARNKLAYQKIKAATALQMSQLATTDQPPTDQELRNIEQVVTTFLQVLSAQQELVAEIAQADQNR